MCSGYFFKEANMEKKGLLVNREGVGNIFKCSCGIIHVNLKAISLRFTESAFLEVAGMFKEGASKFMDEGLKILLSEQE
jgi:hypothetical protein